MITRKRQSMSFSTQNCSGISSISCVYLLRRNQTNTSCASSSIGYTTIVITGSITFFSNYFEFFFSLFARNHIINFLESFSQSSMVFLLFVQFWTFKLLNKDLFDVFRYFNAFVFTNVPPWPSKTPNIELPPPMSNSEIAASSIDLRQPGLFGYYLAFRSEKTWAWAWRFLLLKLLSPGRAELDMVPYAII